ncbi:MAG: membrane protein insertase YidC [Clostridia bacterium]|nr:membrane protein insertase YidC [Clostridia bacterium]
MDSIVNLVIAPNGLWEKIIFAFNNAFVSFALSVIMLTICIKVIMLPFDFFNRYASEKTMRQQAQIAPEIEKIKRKYANDKQKENEEMQKLYKQKNVNPMGSCLFMLVNLALTLTIFITLLNGLNTMASFKIQTQYEQLQQAYVYEYVRIEHSVDIYKLVEDNSKLPEDQQKSVYELVLPYISEMNAIADETTKTEVFGKANKAVADKYEQVKDSFLWIENIWISDTPFSSSIPSFNDYANVARLTAEQKADETFKGTYNQIMDPLRDTNGRANGFLILFVLTGVTAFLSQWLMTKKSKKSAQPQVGTGKFMMFFMPAFMAIFTLMYTSMFSLYLVTSQLLSVATTPLIKLLVGKLANKSAKKAQEKQQVVVTNGVDYRRSEDTVIKRTKKKK